MWRNEPRNTLAAHLFTDDAVEDADLDPTPGGQAASQSVESVCSASESYGPFRRISYEDAVATLPDEDGVEEPDLCVRCVKMWRTRRAGEEARQTAPDGGDGDE